MTSTERELKLGYMMVQYHIGTPGWVESAVVVVNRGAGTEVWAHPVKGRRNPKQLRASDLYCARWVVPERKTDLDSQGAVLWNAAGLYNKAKDDLYHLILAGETCRHTQHALTGVYGKDHKVLKPLDVLQNQIWERVCALYDELCKDEVKLSSNYMLAEGTNLEARIKRLKNETDALVKQAARLTKKASSLQHDDEDVQ